MGHYSRVEYAVLKFSSFSTFASPPLKRAIPRRKGPSGFPRIEWESLGNPQSHELSIHGLSLDCPDIDEACCIQTKVGTPSRALEALVTSPKIV